MATGRVRIVHRLVRPDTTNLLTKNWYQHRRQRAGVEHGTRRRADTELGIQGPIWIGNHCKRHIVNVATQLLIGRVEYDDLTDAGVGDFVVSTHDRLQVNVTNGAARKTPKLQMDKPIRIGYRDCSPGNTGQFMRGDNAARAHHGVFAHTDKCTSRCLTRAVGASRDALPRPKRFRPNQDLGRQVGPHW